MDTNQFVNNTITISMAAEIANVSTATIRNWIKAGYIVKSGRSTLDKDIFSNFLSSTHYHNRLNKRANKSQKDFHDHNALVNNILSEKILDIDSDEIGTFYENHLSDSYRNREGIYYTPENIIRDLFCNSELDFQDKKLLDPCCGSGNFLLSAIDQGFSVENIYGFDIDPVAIEITKKRIYDKTGILPKNIKCLDFLDYQTNLTFDFIFTNPPWGKKFTKEYKNDICKALKASSSLDSSGLFFLKCLTLLNDKGTLAFVLPEAFFNVSNYEECRAIALNYNIKYLSFYGKVFSKLQTNVVSLILEKKEQKNLTKCRYLNDIYHRTGDSFAKNPKRIFNVNCNNLEQEVIEHLYSISHITLKNKAKWGIGIVTGNNKKFIKKNLEPYTIPVIKGEDILKTGLKKINNFITDDLSLYQQTAPRALFEAKEKLIYRFISSDLCFYYDNEQYYTLNSANILITNDDFPIKMKLLSEVLNCELINWLYKKIFNTHKVLRSDIESLPIHFEIIKGLNKFIEADYIHNLKIEKNNGTYRVKN